MRLAQKQLTGLDLARWNRRPDRPEFHAPSRLARVGIFARLIDTAFNASLLLRGTVPGGTTAAAHLKYEKVRQTDPRYVYHGRVLRSDGWIVLHYMYFYFMNDWRSTFSGANDHESDLEQAFVFLEEAPDGPRPVWFACAAHDYSGDQLRRRWDDPYLVKVGDHPVIHAGAGSHAAYFEAGEYMTAAPLPAARRLRGIFEAARSFWRDTLRQPDPGDLATSLERALSIPFIDYARGDGLQIGGEGGASWTPVLIDDTVPVGRWLPGPLRPRYVRSIRRRASAGGTEVHPLGNGSPVLERPDRLGRPGQDGAAAPDAGGARGPARRTRGRPRDASGGERRRGGEPRWPRPRGPGARHRPELRRDPRDPRRRARQARVCGQRGALPRGGPLGLHPRRPARARPAAGRRPR